MSLDTTEKSGSIPPVDPEVINSALNELHLDDVVDIEITSDKNTSIDETVKLEKSAKSDSNIKNKYKNKFKTKNFKEVDYSMNSFIPNADPINMTNASPIPSQDEPAVNNIGQNTNVNFSPLFSPHQHPQMMNMNMNVGMNMNMNMNMNVGMNMNFVPYNQMIHLPPHHLHPQNEFVDVSNENTGSRSQPGQIGDDTNAVMSSNELDALRNNPIPLTNSVTAANEKETDIETRTNKGGELNEDQAYKKKQASPFPATSYPYGGHLLQPNQVGISLGRNNTSANGSHPPPFNSNFPGGYGFNSPFQSFSPILHPSHSPIPPNLAMNPSLSLNPDTPAGANSNSNDTTNGNSIAGLSVEDDSTAVNTGGANPSQYSQFQNGTPPPWMYGAHPFGHMVPHPHSMPPHPHMMNSRNSPNPSSVNGGYNNKDNNRSNYGRNRNNNNQMKSQYLGYPQRKYDESLIYNDATLDQFAGSIYSLCKDQHGCRFLQKQLDIIGENAANTIFEEVKDHNVELMTDSFGNYLIQKLLERITLEQRLTIVNLSAPYFIDIALNPHGTRALQKLLECIETDEEAQVIIDSLKPSIVELSKDLNGNHVVQKILQQLKPEYIQFIFDAACQNCIEIATHRHGCCVLQRCLDRGTPEQCDSLCEQLLVNIDHLSFDPFGNYVIQYVITKEVESGNYNYSYQYIDILKQKIKDLSLHKFGSNVVEKLLRTPVLSETIILELIKNEGKDEIETLLNDSYGNYVLQTALDVSHQNNEVNYKKLSEMVTPLLVGQIRNTPHGRRIMNKLNLE